MIFESGRAHQNGAHCAGQLLSLPLPASTDNHNDIHICPAPSELAVVTDIEDTIEPSCLFRNLVSKANWLSRV